MSDAGCVLDYSLVDRSVNIYSCMVVLPVDYCFSCFECYTGVEAVPGLVFC